MPPLDPLTPFERALINALNAFTKALEESRVSPQSSPTPSEPRWLPTKAAAAQWANLPPKALYDAVSKGKLKAARVGDSGKRLMFCRQWIDDWLTASAGV